MIWKYDLTEVLDSNKPLSWSRIWYPVAVTEETDDQQFVYQGTTAGNGIPAEAPFQIFQNLLS